MQYIHCMPCYVSIDIETLGSNILVYYVFFVDVQQQQTHPILGKTRVPFLEKQM